MSGLGLVLDVAKEALLTQKLAIDVVSHNIANVNTPGYTRQSAILEAKEAAPFAGVMLGRGVSIWDVVRVTDSFIEDRLRDQKTELAAMSEKEVYMSALEGIFSESSGQSLSTQFTEFWNAWQDLSNNPSGMPERNILYERGSLLSQSFQDLFDDLDQMQDEVSSVIRTGVDSVNTLISNIAELNRQIIRIEVSGNANDLRDQRNQALSQLAEYMDVRAYEHEDGNITVTTGRGYVLVSRADAYLLESDGDEIKWQGSGGSEVTITDMISGGKLGGWLDVRDRIVPEYKANLDELAKAAVWQTNLIHTQGVGTQAFSTVTGTYATTDSAEELGTVDSGLAFYDSIVDGTFKLWLYDASGAVVGGAATTLTIDKDPAGTTLNGLVASLNAVHANLTAAVSGGKLTLTASNGYTFAFSDDTSNVLAALGVNTFFTGDSANDISVNSLLNSQKELIAAGRVGATGQIAAGDNSNALAVAALQDQSVTIKSWTYERGETPTSSNETGTIDSYLHSFIGSIGIESQSISRSVDFNEALADRLSQTRDNISAVSLDEEMTTLIQYQHAYAAAAKLISVADEMLKALLEVK
ncbi:MAG: flagellar hook-associated protein FlgK [Thermodesulfobacteriota bacterium]